MKKLLSLLLAALLACALAIPALAEFAPISQDQIKVGFIYIGDVGDRGYTYTHHQGTLYMQQELGLRDDQIIIKTNVSEDASCETAIRELVEQGCSIIFGNSFGYMDYMAEAAEEFPEVIFSHCSGYKSNDTNFNNYFGRIYQARFLSGLAAGLKTKSNKIGFVAAMKIPEVVGGLDAYALGIKAANPDAKVYVMFTNTWYDPTVERAAAEALLDMGCDVIGQHQDTAMPQIAAQERGVWSTGYNADMTVDAPKAHLTAPIWNWGVYVKDAVQKVIEGTWTPENSFMGMVEGLVDISPLSENCEPGTEALIASYRAKILDGSFDVFDGEIKDNQGNVVVPAGTRLGIPEITTIDWYLDNVEKVND